MIDIKELQRLTKEASKRGEEEKHCKDGGRDSGYNIVVHW